MLAVGDDTDDVWEALGVSFDSESVEQEMSPWEVEVHGAAPFIPPRLPEELSVGVFAALDGLARTEAASLLADSAGAVIQNNLVSSGGTTAAHAADARVAVTLELILTRVRSGYYRQWAAVAHDVHAMLAFVDGTGLAPLADALRPLLLTACAHEAETRRGWALKMEHAIESGGLDDAMAAALEATAAATEAAGTTSVAGGPSTSDQPAARADENEGAPDANRKRKRRVVVDDDDEDEAEAARVAATADREARAAARGGGGSSSSDASTKRFVIRIPIPPGVVREWHGSGAAGASMSASALCEACAGKHRAHTCGRSIHGSMQQRASSEDVDAADETKHESLLIRLVIPPPTEAGEEDEGAEEEEEEEEEMVEDEVEEDGDVEPAPSRPAICGLGGCTRLAYHSGICEVPMDLAERPRRRGGAGGSFRGSDL